MKKIEFLLLGSLFALLSCGNSQNGVVTDINQKKDCVVKCDSNQVIETIMSRRSIRKYKDIPVEKDKLELLAKCGINAPSAMNKQSWEVRIVDNKEYIDGITEIYKKENPKAAEGVNFKNMFRNAPAVIFIGSPIDGSAQFDCGLLAENIMLAAKFIGLGTCCLGSPASFMSSKIGRESCRERVVRLVLILVGAGSLKKQSHGIHIYIIHTHTNPYM